MAGELLEGFAIRSGIRKGCPHSPLLFEMCGVLRKLSSGLPADTLRVYADDLVLVSNDIWRSAAAVGPIFEQFAWISGLGLNLQKTVFVPLGDDATETFRSELERQCPGWGAAPIRLYANYLGSCLGPEAGERAWNKAFDKVAKRAVAWGALGLGMHFSTLAYNFYVPSVLTFLLRLDRLPSAGGPGSRTRPTAACRRQ